MRAEAPPLQEFSEVNTTKAATHPTETWPPCNGGIKCSFNASASSLPNWIIVSSAFLTSWQRNKNIPYRCQALLQAFVKFATLLAVVAANFLQRTKALRDSSIRKERGPGAGFINGLLCRTAWPSASHFTSGIVEARANLFKWKIFIKQLLGLDPWQYLKNQTLGLL